MDEKKPDVNAEVKTPETEKQPTLEELQKQISDLIAENSTLKADAEKAKKTISNANEDAANWKRQFRATQDEATRKAAEEAEAKQALMEELTALKTEKRISSYQAKLMEVGYDPTTAATMATALPDGISDDFFATQKQFLEAQKQLAKTEALNSQPALTPGLPPASPSKDEEYIRKWMGLPLK